MTSTSTDRKCPLSRQPDISFVGSVSDAVNILRVSRRALARWERLCDYESAWCHTSQHVPSRQLATVLPSPKRTFLCLFIYCCNLLYCILLFLCFFSVTSRRSSSNSTSQIKDLSSTLSLLSSSANHHLSIQQDGIKATNCYIFINRFPYYRSTIRIL